ncbi:MAG: PQQ-binding-like beta-propeller repeat protein, partial [Acidobacteriota bacterium]
RGTERVVALDEATGKVLWSYSWEADYAGLEPRYAIGPRVTPTIDGDQVYVLGAMGQLISLDVESGKVLWQKDFVADYGTKVPIWGMSGAPLVDGSLLICLVGGQEGAEIVAFDKATGREVWRALDAGSEPGYNPPTLVEAGGRRQLIIWHPKAVSALEPRTGKVLWEEPFDVQLGLTVATPVFDGQHLLVSAFFEGSMLLDLAAAPKAKRVWKVGGKSEIDSEGLHALITTPVIDGDAFYGVGSYGELRGLDLASGERLWESRRPVVEKARWAAAFLVRHEDRTFISNDRGELIIARLDRQGYHEIDRTELIEPTSPVGRRERGAVHWSHPAYANRHIVVRNDKEIVRASLAKVEAKPSTGSH